MDDTWMELPVPSEVCRRLGPIIPTSRRWAAWSSETSSGDGRDVAVVVDAAVGRHRLGSVERQGRDRERIAGGVGQRRGVGDLTRAVGEGGCRRIGERERLQLANRGDVGDRGFPSVRGDDWDARVEGRS